MAVVHFESDAREEIRSAQARETAEFGAHTPYLTPIGGDMNCAFYGADLSSGSQLDQTARAFLSHGYYDAHANPPPSDRGTRNVMILDVIMGTDDRFSNSAVGSDTAWGDLSDHRPVWTDVDLLPPDSRR